MTVFQVGITVSKRIYRDVIVRLEADTLKEAKLNAMKELRKLFATTDSEEIDSFFAIMAKGEDDWYSYDVSLEDWDVETQSGTDYSDMTSEHAHVPHIDLTSQE